MVALPRLELHLLAVGRPLDLPQGMTVEIELDKTYRMTTKMPVVVKRQSTRAQVTSPFEKLCFANKRDRI